MNKIPISVPVFIQNVESQENERYSTAKLKILYIGETPDHRLFTKEFSDKLMKSLPSTPVVGYYSEEDKDFKGHNSIQYVYGHVPETADISYEEDDSGHTFAITDVILYTERNDNIGEVAKKIVGKQHSLEIDKKTLKYKINRDKNGSFLNIEITEGNFIGLSVLGDNETPAFKGSEFFTVNENFKEFAIKSRDNFDKFLNYLNQGGGEIQVFNSKNFFEKMENFLSMTMQGFQEEIYSAFDEKGIYAYICENTEDYVIVSQYSDHKYRYMKYPITKNAEKLSLGEPVEVKTKFLTEEEALSLSAVADAACKPKDKKEDAITDGDDQPLENANSSEPNDTADVQTVEDGDAQATVQEPASVSNSEQGDISGTTETTNAEEKTEKNEVGNATASVSVAALSDPERTELERYRKAEKITLIDSYSADLDEELLNQYRLDVDKYTIQDININLALEFRNFIKSKADVASFKTITTFSKITTAKDYNENNPADVIKKYKNI